MEDNWYEEQLEKTRKKFKEDWNKFFNDWFSDTHDYIMKKYGQGTLTKATDDVRERITGMRRKDTHEELDGVQKTNFGVGYCLAHPQTFEISAALSKDKVEWKIGDVSKQGKIDSFELGYEYNTINLIIRAGIRDVSYPIDSLAKAEERVPLFTTDSINNAILKVENSIAELKALFNGK